MTSMGAYQTKCDSNTFGRGPNSTVTADTSWHHVPLCTQHHRNFSSIALFVSVIKFAQLLCFTRCLLHQFLNTRTCSHCYFMLLDVSSRQCIWIFLVYISQQTLETAQVSLATTQVLDFVSLYSISGSVSSSGPVLKQTDLEPLQDTAVWASLISLQLLEIKKRSLTAYAP